MTPPGSSTLRRSIAPSIVLSLLLLTGVPPLAAHPSGSGPARDDPASVPVAPGWSTALDWPTYLGNPERTSFDQNESALAAGNISGLRIAWIGQTPGPIESSPVVADGHVFVSSWDGNVSSFNLSDGTLDWRTSVGTSTFPSCAASGPRGPTATPTIANGTVYIPGGDPYFYALNESSGAIEWRVSNLVNHPSSGDYNWGSPLVYGNAAYYGLSSACGSPGAQGMVIMINLNGTTHNVTHEFAVVPPKTVLGGVWSTPAIDPSTNLVWVTSGDGPDYGQSIFALNATTLALVGAWQQPTANLDYDFGAGPTLFHDASGRPMVAALNKNGVVYALNRSNVSATGWRPVWSLNVSWYNNVSQGEQAGDYDLAPAAFDGTNLYVGGGFARLSNGTNVAGTVTSIVPASGSVLWRVGVPGVVRAGVAAADGLVFDAANQPDNLTTWFEVRSSSTGQLLYRLHLNGTINAAPTLSGGLVLFGSGGWGPKGAGAVWALTLPLAAAWAGLPTATDPGVPTSFRSTISGGTPPYSFSWSFGDGTGGSAASAPSHSFADPGTFAVSATITDGTGQSAVLRGNITVDDLPLFVTNLSATPSSPIVGAPMSVLVATTGGWGPLGYSFSSLPNGCTSENRSTVTCVPTTAGAFHWGVVVRDGYGEVASAFANLTVDTAPPVPLAIVALIAAPNPVESGATFEILVVPSGGVGELSFVYDGLPSGCASENSSELTCSTNSAGTYRVEASVTDSAAQSVTRSVNLTVEARAVPPLSVQSFVIAPSTIAVGQTVELIVVTGGGSGPVTVRYTGLPPGCEDATGAQAPCTPSHPGVYNVSATATDGAGGSTTVSTALTVVAAPESAAGTSSTALSWPLAVAIAAGAFMVGVAVTWVGRRPPRRP